MDSDRILSAILESQERTDVQIGKLADSVQKLVILDATRAEREEYQKETNKRFGAFMDDSRKLLDRLENLLNTWDKAKIPVVVLIVLSMLSAAGYNLKG